MNIFFDDGSRLYKNTGYGNLARSLAESLAQIHGVQLYINKPIPCDPGINVDYLNDYENIQPFKWQPVDCVFRVGPPSVTRMENKKTILYTQNALGGLRTTWKEAISKNDAIIVPGEFDRKVFEPYAKKVYICPQTVDNKSFKPAPNYRHEGDDAFTFLFVGSFSYRKGVDLLINGFAEAFKHIEHKACLHLLCPTGLENTDSNLNSLIAWSRTAPDNLKITCNNSNLTPAWMNRTYNRCDAVITLSRGEGWCMPLHEALLCEKPVIAPNSTAMREHLPTEGTIKLPIEEKLASTIKDDFGLNFKTTYSEPDISVYEVNTTSLTNSILDMMNAYKSYQKAAKTARRKILDSYNVEQNSKRLEKILIDWSETF